MSNTFRAPCGFSFADGFSQIILQEMNTFNKRSLTKPDGRSMTLYSRREIDTKIEATNPIHDPVTNRPHLRWHPLRAEWVAFAAHRQNRTFLPPKEYNPLAPSASKEHPTELPVGDYDVAVFDNLFSSLDPRSETAPAEYVPTRPADGTTEVIVFTQDPEGSLSRLPLDHIELLLKVWADRTSEITRTGHIKYVLPFENRGVEVGVTLHHPHGQIYAYPFIPPVQMKMVETQKAHFSAHNRGLFEDIIASERKAADRMIFDDGQTVSFIPCFARYPYETYIAPVRKVPYLSSLTDKEIKSLALVLKTTLLKFDALWSKPFPYLMALYQAPTDGDSHDEFHMHFEFYPPLRTKDRLKYLAGTEIAAGLFVNDSLPEEKAVELRQIEIQL